MSKYLDRAMQLRQDPNVHYSCSQSVFMPFAELAGMTEEMANKVAANFGGGMRIAGVCGAITGALMALGACGLDDPAMVQSIFRRIRENHEGCINCADLLRISKQKGEVKKWHCDGMVYECVKIVEDILREQGKID